MTNGCKLKLHNLNLGTRRSGPFIPTQTAPGTHLRLDVVTDRKIPGPSENRIPFIQPVARRFTDSTLLHVPGAVLGAARLTADSFRITWQVSPLRKPHVHHRESLPPDVLWVLRH